MSRPVLKARGPAPERITARIWGVVVMVWKRRGSACHILESRGD